MEMRKDTLKILGKESEAGKRYIESWKQVKKQFQQVLQEIQDSGTPYYIAREKYELCLACNDYKLGTIREILRRCTDSSIRDNESRILDFYANVCKFEPVVVDMIMLSLINHEELKSYMGIFAEVPNSVGVEASEKAINISFNARANSDKYIKLYIHPSHTKEDVKWFIDHELGLRDNLKSRNSIRISKKGFVERMLIGRLSFMQWESSSGIENTLKAIAEGDEKTDDDIESYTATEISIIKDKSKKKYSGVFDDLEAEFGNCLQKHPKIYKVSSIIEETALDTNKFEQRAELRRRRSQMFNLVYSDKDKKFHLEEV